MASRKTAAARVAEGEQQGVRERAGDLDLAGRWRRLAQVADADDRPARDGHRGEQDGHEEQAAAEEDGREEAVLALPDLVADDRDEPQEHDPGERRQVQPADERREVLARGELPDQLRVAGVEHRLAAQEQQGRREEQREEEAGDARRPGRPQLAPGLLDDGRDRRGWAGVAGSRGPAARPRS